MKKQHFYFLLVIIMILISACFITSCDNTKDSGGDEDLSGYDCAAGIHKYTDDNACAICNMSWPYTNGLKYVASDDGESYFVSGIGSATDAYIVLPFMHKGKPVTGINRCAFDACNGVLNVTLHDGITTIEEYAFNACSNLQSITLGKNVTSIEKYAFFGCTSLTEINYNAIKCRDLFVGNDVFGYAGAHSDGVTVTFGESVEYIPAYLFNPNTIIEHAVNISKVNIPSGITQIGTGAFGNCLNLTEITVDENNTSYKSADGVLYTKDGTVLMQYAIGRTDKSFIIPNGVTSIESGAFAHSNALSAVELPETLKSIGTGAFERCIYLESLNFPDSLEEIGANAYLDCIRVSEMTVGSGLAKIGAFVFYQCQSLKSITVSEDNESFKSVDDCIFSKDGSSIVLYAVGSSKTSFRIPDDVTTVRSGAFAGAEKLTELIIGKNVSVIEDSAFIDCINLVKLSIESDKIVDLGARVRPFNNIGKNSNNLTVTFEEGVTNIPANLFYDAYGVYIKKVVIADSVTTIGSSAFYNCPVLESVTVGKGVTQIKDNAFSDCKALKELYFNAVACENMSSIKKVFDGIGVNDSNGVMVVFGNDVTRIPAYLFNYKSERSKGRQPKIRSIKLGNSVLRIGESAFADCEMLTVINIPSSVRNVGKGAFLNCNGLARVNVTDISSWVAIEFADNYSNPLYYADSLYLNNSLVTSVNIASGTERIGSFVFCDYIKLKSMTIPSSVTEIGDWAFRGCTGLTNVVIGSGVKDIGGYAFAYCTGITSLTLGTGTESIGTAAFYGCNGITSLTIPAGTKHIGKSAFWDCSKLTSVTFEAPNGWEYSSVQEPTANSLRPISSEQLTDKATAANVLKLTLGLQFWFKK